MLSKPTDQETNKPQRRLGPQPNEGNGQNSHK